MKIEVLAVGKTTTSYIREAVSDYVKRINHYMPAEFVYTGDIKNLRSLSQEQQKQREGEAILAYLQPSDQVILLDERGKQFTSREFASKLEQLNLASTRRLIMVIGGPYGFSESVYERANMLLSLSKMTFSHEMVRLFIVEQIYRAMTILRGEPYHHD